MTLLLTWQQLFIIIKWKSKENLHVQLKNKSIEAYRIIPLTLKSQSGRKFENKVNESWFRVYIGISEKFLSKNQIQDHNSFLRTLYKQAILIFLTDKTEVPQRIRRSYIWPWMNYTRKGCAIALAILIETCYNRNGLYNWF